MPPSSVLPAWMRRTRRMLSAAALPILLLLVLAPSAHASGSPNITLATGGDDHVLYGAAARVTLSAANPLGQPLPGYNLSFRAVIGQAVSHGCIRMRNADILALRRWARPGTRLVIRR